MVFTSISYIFFFCIVFSVYWLLRKKTFQNLFLLIASYIFYGFVHPWFCTLIAASTFLDYFCALAMDRYKHKKKVFLLLSCVVNLLFLGFFKYFNFFSENLSILFSSIGWQIPKFYLDVLLPVGISFYTFQTLSYTIDVYKEELEARKNFIDFALFVSFFPQLVAGPIERASKLLPQIENKRTLSLKTAAHCAELLLLGVLKKIVVADNISLWVDRIFMLQSPSFVLLFVGSIGFSIQIFADFSAYTDIARGSAGLLGFDLMENFKAPYLAISPSDFWRRWHISFSSWIRDYLYIPLGGSKREFKTQVSTLDPKMSKEVLIENAEKKLAFDCKNIKEVFAKKKRAFTFSFRLFLTLMITMLISGLWHGASWNFVLWGAYHGLLLFVYHALSLGGNWRPKGKVKLLIAWSVMQFFSILGWMLFRASSISWLFDSFKQSFFALDMDIALVSIFCLSVFLCYTLPWSLLFLQVYFKPKAYWTGFALRCLQLAAVILISNPDPQQFIYFQF